MKPGATPSAAYLEAIFEMQEESIPTQQARIADWLDVTPASVSEAVKRLTRDDLVELVDRQVHLLPAGDERARALIRRRRLAEVFLVEILGLPWHRARDESSRWVQAISQDVEALMTTLLADPTSCPHGNPIPRPQGGDNARVAVTKETPIRLTETMPDEEVSLVRLREDLGLTPTVTAGLESAGLLPGATLRILQAAPDGAISVLVGERATTVPAEIAGNLWVRRPTDESRAAAPAVGTG